MPTKNQDLNIIKITFDFFDILEQNWFKLVNFQDIIIFFWGHLWAPLLKKGKAIRQNSSVKLYTF